MTREEMLKEVQETSWLKLKKDGSYDVDVSAFNYNKNTSTVSFSESVKELKEKISKLKMFIDNGFVSQDYNNLVLLSESLLGIIDPEKKVETTDTDEVAEVAKEVVEDIKVDLEGLESAIDEMKAEVKDELLKDLFEAETKPVVTEKTEEVKETKDEKSLCNKLKDELRKLKETHLKKNGVKIALSVIGTVVTGTILYKVFKGGRHE